MGPVLADTSAWINYFKSVRNSSSEILSEYIIKSMPLFICPVIVQEILQGIKNDFEYQEIKESLLDLNILNLDSIETAIGSAELYRSLRKKGVTIRKSYDVVIAYYAIFYNLPLLHNDSDFNLIAKHSPLKIYKP